MTHTEFIEFWGNLAVERYRQGNTILPSLVICQAILESGWGTTDKATELNNYHGIKWYNDSVCRPYAYVDCNTWEEYTPGEITTITSAFCKFDTIADELNCYYSWLHRDNPYYKQLWGCTDAYKCFDLINKSPYATDTHYGEKLKRIYDTYTAIAKYDSMVVNTKVYRVQTGAYLFKFNAVRQANAVNSALHIRCIIKRYGGLYHTQVGAYTVYNNALAMADKLQSLGFKTFITTEDGEEVAY